MAKLTRKSFLQSGTWIAPPGVTDVILIGCGGGGGGGGGSTAATSAGGAGGGGALQGTDCVSVVPGTAYNIVIGNGGIGGVSSTPGGVGSPGGDTSFGTLSSFSGASGGGGGNATNLSAGGQCIKYIDGTNLYCTSTSNTSNIDDSTVPSTGTVDELFLSIASGGPANEAVAGTHGARNPIGGFAGGTVGVTAASGGGGGAGPKGIGGAGAPTSGAAAGNGAPNTGAGGGGGFGTNGSSATAGGNGGSGYLFVCYVA
jgi:hypothetical protein